MRFASAVILLSVLCSGPVRAAARPSSCGGDPDSSMASAAPAQSDMQDLRVQVEKMKILVQQMEQNLAFVGTEQSPLKHQFQLEIEMWKVMIADMEKKLNSSPRR